MPPPPADVPDGHKAVFSPQQQAWFIVAEDNQAHWEEDASTVRLQAVDCRTVIKEKADANQLMGMLTLATVRTCIMRLPHVAWTANWFHMFWKHLFPAHLVASLNEKHTTHKKAMSHRRPSGFGVQFWLLFLKKTLSTYLSACKHDRAHLVIPIPVPFLLMFVA